MGYHTVTLPSPVTVTEGQRFTVAVKVTSPGASYPIAVEYPVRATTTSGATASTGQSYISLNGSSWTGVAGPARQHERVPQGLCEGGRAGRTSAVTAPSGSPRARRRAASLPVTWTTNQAVTSGQFSIWVVDPANGLVRGQDTPPPTAPRATPNGVDLNVPVDAGYRVYVYYRAALGDPW